MFLREKAGQKGMTFNLSIHQSFRTGTKIRGSDRIGDIAETKDRNGGKTDFSLCTEI